MEVLVLNPSINGGLNEHKIQSIAIFDDRIALMALNTNY